MRKPAGHEYPTEYEKHFVIGDQDILLRPIRHDDTDKMLKLFYSFKKETIYKRFFMPLKIMQESEIKSRYLDVDYNERMAIVASFKEKDVETLLGVVRYAVDDSDSKRAEYAIVIRDDWQGKGLGILMTEYLVKIAREKGITRIYALVMDDNWPMRDLLEKLYRTEVSKYEPGVLKIEWKV